MKNKKVILGVSGGIAAYKTAELARLLVKAGCETKVAMTKNATWFVSPLTFETLTGHEVIWDMFGRSGTAIDHIEWGQDTDLIVIAPATANIIAKIAHGIADDFISTMILATTARVLVCPAMNTQMYQNLVTQDNLELLRKRDFTIMDPGVGNLACRTEGPGRMPEPVDIYEQIQSILSIRDLEGLNILVTAGPTVESIDPVRFISNRSTGKMGYALAKRAFQRGASVALVSGPTSLPPPLGVALLNVKSAEDMRQAVLSRHSQCDIIIKAAAVSDYKPKSSAPQKMKKDADSMSLDLVKNPDILAELGRLKKVAFPLLIGFAAETESLTSNAAAKLKAKNLDLIVANDVSRADAGFEAETNQVKMIQRNGAIEESPLLSKDGVADLVLDKALQLYEEAVENRT